MAPLTERQKELLRQLYIGREVHVATSEYSLDHNARMGWLPVTKAHASTIRSLIESGHLEGKVYWRGATVTRLK